MLGNRTITFVSLVAVLGVSLGGCIGTHEGGTDVLWINRDATDYVEWKGGPFRYALPAGRAMLENFPGAGPWTVTLLDASSCRVVTSVTLQEGTDLVVIENRQAVVQSGLDLNKQPKSDGMIRDASQCELGPQHG
jgi:hypothetical protein